jgi:hypothetical protein
VTSRSRWLWGTLTIVRSKADYSLVGAWDLLRNLREFVAAREEGRGLAERRRSSLGALRVYTGHDRAIEEGHC